VRAMLEWSEALLSRPDLTVLRRVSVFVSPFTASAAAEEAGFAPLDPGDVVEGLARLADQSLLTVAASAGGTRYRALETIRQYGIERLTEAGELVATRAHHLGWCLATARELADDPSPTTGDWRARFDAAADDLRVALSWAAERPDQRADAHQLALSLAHLAFTRNLVGESQQRYEQAAALAGDPAAAAAALRCAANVAACRMRGDDAHRLWKSAADVAQSAGDTAAASRDLATAATTYFRKAGAFAQLPPRDEATALLSRARQLAGDDLAAQAALALADCAALGYAFFAEQAQPKKAASEMTALAERAVELARRLDDPLAECAALWALTGAQRREGDTFAAAATARRRVDLLQSVPVTPGIADELIDALLIATAIAIGVGDLPAARRWGGQLRDLPPLAETGHVATSRLLMADALAGHATDVVAASSRFLDGWTQAGRPPARNFGPVAAAVAMIHGLRGDQAARAEWLALLDELGVTLEDRSGYSPTFDAIVLLHDGQAALALERLDTQAGETGETGRPNLWRTGIMLHWHVAVRAEAAVLAGQPGATDHLASARPLVAGNPIATAIVDRAAALLDGDHDRLLATATVFETAGCPYQRARTLILAGGDTAPTGNAALTDLGLTPATKPRVGGSPPG
jgi:hypothetical protein